MRRFEYIRGNQAKFWEVVRKGAVITTASGKIGKSPKKKTKQHTDYMVAEQEFDRLVRAARVPAPQLTHSLTKPGAPSRPGRVAAASRTA